MRECLRSNGNWISILIASRKNQGKINTTLQFIWIGWFARENVCDHLKNMCTFIYIEMIRMYENVRKKSISEQHKLSEHIYVCKAHIPKNTMRYKGIARYSFFGYLSIYIKIYMVEIITNNTRVLLVFFYFSFCLCFFPVSLHCINSSRGKNNRGCSLWEKEKEEKQKIASHSNTMRTRQPKVNKKTIWVFLVFDLQTKTDEKGAKRSRNQGNILRLSTLVVLKWLFFISDFGIEVMQLLWK